MGVLEKVVDAATKVGNKMATAPSSEAAGIKARKDNIDEYMNATKPAPAETAPKPGPVMKRSGKTDYGAKKGEERIDVSDMTKPLGSFAKGTTKVPKTGMYQLHKDEAVIPAHENAGMYDKVAGMKKPRKAKKEIDHIKIRKAKTGGHIVEHHYTHPDHKMEEHVAPDMDALHDHLDQTMGAASAPPAPDAAAAPGPVAA